LLINEVLLSLQKEGNSAVCSNISEPWWHCTRWNRTLAKEEILHVPLIWGVFTEAERRMVTVKSWEEWEMGSFCSIGKNV
jgi:hypothetical protein